MTVRLRFDDRLCRPLGFHRDPGLLRTLIRNGCFGSPVGNLKLHVPHGLDNVPGGVDHPGPILVDEPARDHKRHGDDHRTPDTTAAHLSLVYQLGGSGLALFFLFLPDGFQLFIEASDQLVAILIRQTGVGTDIALEEQVRRHGLVIAFLNGADDRRPEVQLIRHVLAVHASLFPRGP